MPTLVVMAAGLGTRYGRLKQIEHVGPDGEMLMDYAVYDAQRAGFDRVIFVIRAEIAGVIGTLRRRAAGRIEIAAVIQDDRRLPEWLTPPDRTAPWGTVHAVLAASDVVQGAFAVINADDFYGAAAYRLASAAFDDSIGSGSYAVMTLPLSSALSEHGPVSRALCRVGPEGWIEDIEEVSGISRTNGSIEGVSATGRRTLDGRSRASMNFWMFDADVFPRLWRWFERFLRARGADRTAEAMLPDAMADLIRAGVARVRAVDAPGPWLGLTHTADRERTMAGLRALHSHGDYPTPLWQPTNA